MAILDYTFNVDDLGDVGGSGAAYVPDGKYKAVIIEDEWKDVAGKSNKYIQMSVRISEGDHVGVILIERLNVINDNKTAVEMSYNRLGNISKALGLSETPKDTSKLHNQPLIIEVVTEKGKPWIDNQGVERAGSDKSVIKKYYPVSAGVGSAPGLAAQAPVASSQAKPW